MELREKGTLVQDEWSSVDIVLSKMHDLHDLVSRIKAAIVSNEASEQEIGYVSGDEAGERTVAQSPSNSKIITASYHWAVRPE